MEISNTDVDFFQEHGWWVSPPIFSDAELDLAAAEQDRFYRGEHDCADPIAGMPFPGWDPRTGDPHALRKNDYASVQNPLFRTTLIEKSKVAAFAAALMGADSVRLWHDQLLYKPPLPADDVPRGGNGIVAFGWHTDHQYWRCCTGPMLTAWIPFDDVSLDMGPVVMLDGSHRWDTIDGMEFYDADLDAVLARIADAGHEVVEVPVVMRRGQVSFHHWKTIHGSHSNHSDRPRRSIAVHLQAGCNRWQPVTDHSTNGPFEHRNDRLVGRTADGVPDYADADFCPQLFPRH